MNVLAKDFKRNQLIYLMLLPVVLYYIIFKYMPMYGVVIAFKDFNVSRGIFESKWVGLEHFQAFFDSYYFWRLLRNTLMISLWQLVWGFPAPIVLALLLNEIRQAALKRLVQTVTYIPHFVSIIVISGLLIDFLSRGGLVNQLVVWLGGEPTAFLGQPEYFRTIYVGSEVWQEIGWGSIIYLAALSGINPELYEASKIDGAGVMQKMWSVSIPGILPTIIILFILRVGHMMDIGYEKIILLYNPNTYETADVISTFVYRQGLLSAQYSYTTAVGLFQSVINFALLIAANLLSRHFTGNRLW